MPQLKINVNGQKFVISGLSRSACSKQLLCALAKVNPPVEFGPKGTGSSPCEGFSTSGIHTNGACSNQSSTVGNKNSAEKCEDVFQTLLILGKENNKKKGDKRSEKVSTKRSLKNLKETPLFGKDDLVTDRTLVKKAAKQEKLFKSADPAKDNLVDDKLEKSLAPTLKNGNYFKNLKETGKPKRAPLTGASYEYLSDLVKAQKKCLKTQHRRIREKEKTIMRYSKRISPAKADDIQELVRKADSDKNLETAQCSRCDDKAAETDHDTGISEQHSSDMDGSCETQTNRPAEVSAVTYSLDNKDAESLITKQCARTFADREICREEESTSKLLTGSAIATTEPTFHRSACSRIQICADEKSSGVECVAYSNSTLVENLESRQITGNGSNHEAELEKEVWKIRVDIKSLQSQLDKQNRVINLLTNLAEQNEIDEHENDKEVDGTHMEEQVRSLRSSINLSIELYDYQKSEMEANATALQHTEREIRRKRWHVDSLRKHLDSLTMCTHSNKGKEKRTTGKYYRLAGTLV